MNAEEIRAVLGVVLMAAYADGGKADKEREELRRVAEALGAEAAALNLPALYQEVLLKRLGIREAAAALKSPETRQLAYELAVGMCDADDLRNEAETRFLAELGSVLGLNPPQMAEPAAYADALTTMPLPAPEAAPAGPVVAAAPVDTAALDKMIMNTAILNGALELLPQSMATMAIIPLQMRLVYRIGKQHGYELDRGHIKDFLATVGVGLTGQYLEEIGRKLIGGLFGKVAGRMAGGLARGATGMAFSFATTYALGKIAVRYYAGGRTMNTQTLKDGFAQLVQEARGVQARVQPQIEQQARSLDVNKILQVVRES